MRSSANRMLATIFGAAYLLIGGAGFTVTAGVGFFQTPGGLLFGLFEVNLAHNVAHLAIGLALVIAGVAGVRAAKAANVAVGTLYLLLGLAGLFVVGGPFNLLAINGADNVLHIVSTIAGLAIALWPRRDRMRA